MNKLLPLFFITLISTQSTFASNKEDEGFKTFHPVNFSHPDPFKIYTENGIDYSYDIYLKLKIVPYVLIIDGHGVLDKNKPTMKAPERTSIVYLSKDETPTFSDEKLHSSIYENLNSPVGMSKMFYEYKGDDSITELQGTFNYRAFPPQKVSSGLKSNNEQIKIYRVPNHLSKEGELMSDIIKEFINDKEKLHNMKKIKESMTSFTVLWYACRNHF